MASKVRIEHNGKGWIEIFKSQQMQRVVDMAGERIAAAAGPHFSYKAAANNQFTVAGFVSSDKYTGAYEEATNKVLTKAVKP